MHRGRIDDAILGHMPVISIFFGIVIRMYHKEHEPRHFHAEHQAQDGKGQPLERIPPLE